jgi:hypothetical protein
MGDRFTEIKDKIDNDPKYRELRCICKFFPDEKRLEYKTEGIYPNSSDHTDRTPILFLFSNPHPVSVKNGLLLSVKGARTFWTRLFESKELRLPDDKMNLECWDKTTPKILGNLMLEGIYKSPFIIYFHCLYPVPTRQLPDLYSLFGAKTPLWQQIKTDGIKELAQLLKGKSIKHVVIFTGSIFQLITGVDDESIQGWRKNLFNAMDDFQTSKDKENYWSQLSSSKANAKPEISEDASVYHALDTHAKDWYKGMEKRYFTLALDMIFEKIRNNQ